MCVVGLRGEPRRPPTPPLTRLRLDGILLCEAHGRCRDEGEAPNEKEGAQRMADDDMNEQADRPRRKVPPIKVWVTDGEKAEIADRAAQAGLSLSAYMLAAGLNHPIRSVYDLKAVADLGRVNGDLGRVAGLLKLWLAEKRGQGARPIDVEKMMTEFRALQTELSAIMRRALK